MNITFAGRLLCVAVVAVVLVSVIVTGTCDPAATFVAIIALLLVLVLEEPISLPHPDESVPRYEYDILARAFVNALAAHDAGEPDRARTILQLSLARIKTIAMLDHQRKMAQEERESEPVLRALQLVPKDIEIPPRKWINDGAAK